MLTKIVKRDGRIVDFDAGKIGMVIHKALAATKCKDREVAKDLAAQVVAALEKTFADKIPHVENAQDAVEEVLIKNNYAKTAKAYILYRQKRKELREAKRMLGIHDELKLSLNAITVLERRYLLKDELGRVIETPSKMFQRVANAIAAVDKLYDEKADLKAAEEEFYQMLANLEFLPNSPTLMNAGTELGQLSACFVLPVGDSIKSIFEAVMHMALIHQSGGGTGFSFSRLRPRGDLVKSTRGVASGPVSFMRVFDMATDVIKQGGKRRGANMGILRVDHPDILEFITLKEKEGVLSNFNISVGITDKFVEAVKRNKEHELVNPRTKKPVKKLKARDVFDLIAAMAWRTGDPGVVFLDEINQRNPTPALGDIESTNPCGEVPLLPHESCNLGSINLSKMTRGKDGEAEVDWEKLRRIVHTAVHFLDNVIDANRYPLPEIERMTKANRKIGLGVMGFADMLLRIGVPYDSKGSIAVAEKVMKFINKESKRASSALAEKRGSFLNFKGSIWEKQGYKGMRNATATTIAPTGTISIIAGTSSSIEPIFAVSFIRNVMGTQLLEVNPAFESVAKERGFHSAELMIEIARRGSIRDMNGIPRDVRRVFATSMDIATEWHVRMQAAFQKHVDNAVSKTVNMPHEATLEQVKKIFLLAHKLRCKGITIYRYGSKSEQVLYVGISEAGKEAVTANSEYAGGCPTGVCLV